jgi:CRP/FNR family cyclic AMP-dependent transcriptional regulator
MSKAGQAQALEKVPLFADLTPQELESLARRAVLRHYRPGEWLFAEGEPCEGLFVIESGEVRIFKSSPGGREQVLGIEGSGNSVAELPVFDGGAYPASAAALTEVTIRYIPKQDFRAFCLEHPQVALKVLKVVGGRLRRLVDVIEELSFTTVRQRFAALLLRLALRKGERTARGVEFTLPATNQELASQLGTVRELVSRNLSSLQAAGVVRLEGRRVIVPEIKALENEATPQE